MLWKSHKQRAVSELHLYVQGAHLYSDQPELLQALQHVFLNVFIFLIGLQQGDGIVMILAVDLVNLLKFWFKVQENFS